MQVAIFGSANQNISKRNMALCRNLAEFLVSKNISVATGASTGIPGQIIKHVHLLSGKTIGYSPDKNELSHEKRFDNLELRYFSKVKFINGFTKRSLKMIHESDFAIVINGRMGTLSEFTIAVEEGMDVIVLNNSGGMSSHLEKILKLSKKKFKNKILFTSNYKKIIKQLLLSLPR